MKETKISSKRNMSNHIEEYFSENSQQNEKVLTSKELFRATPEDVDIKTDLKHEEIILINKLKFNDMLLRRKGLRPIYDKFLNNYLRLKISLDRKSRGEFVTMNQGQGGKEDVLDTMSKISNITNVKK